MQLSLVTPYSSLLERGTYRITVPSSFLSGETTCNFLSWGDGDTIPVREVVLNSDVSMVMAYLVEVVPPPEYPLPTPMPIPNPYPISTTTPYVRKSESGGYQIVFPATVEV